MASAQVLSNSSRKEHLEAGKRRLEEFRKKKAADRAKKAASASLPQAADSTAYEKKALDNGQARHLHSGEAGTSGGVGDAVRGHSGLVMENAERSYGFSHANELKPTTSVNADPSSMNHNVVFFSSPSQTRINDQEREGDSVAGLINQANSHHWQQAEIAGAGGHIGGGRYMDGILSDKSRADHQNVSGDDSSSYNNHRYLRLQRDLSNENSGFPEVSICINSDQSDLGENVHHERSGSTLLPSKSDSSQPRIHLRAPEFEESAHETMDLNERIVSGLEERKLNYSSDPLPSLLGKPVQVTEKLSTDFHFDGSGPFSHAPQQLAVTETHPRRSRPSFLDSLNIPRAPSASGFTQHEPSVHDSPRAPNMEVAATSGSQKPFPETAVVESPSRLETPNVPNSFSGNAFWGKNVYENGIERKLKLHSQKQNEDFSALEQHIEDLTQERFSLQRALDASKALAESLAAENSSLTESYNQQASVVNQLKFEMEKLQEEIKAQLGELDFMRVQYTNTQLECNAADERAKLLASEVIGLEEKALRLRSNELKLEKELERSNNELFSCKKKLSSLEKDRQDLQLTVDALQEEKKLLQSKLRKASARGTSDDINKGYPKKDVSTSTDDLGVEVDTLINGETVGSMISTSNLEGRDAAVPYSSDLHTSDNGPFGFLSSMIIPPDQLQLIENINSLISELTAEKEELTQSLMTEISASSKLKDLNKELSKKLEVQTQRLELLTAQSMANESMPGKQPTDSRIMQDNVAYTDEGDESRISTRVVKNRGGHEPKISVEVVERVLGWIMKLFPGGASRRRTSKRL